MVSRHLFKYASTMKVPLAIELVFYGVVLAVASIFAQDLAPEIPASFQHTGLAAGLLVFLCGMVGLLGLRGRFCPLLVQTAVSLLLVVELIATWRRSNFGTYLGILFLAIMLIFSISLIVMLARPAPPEADPFARRAPEERNPVGRAKTDHAD